MQHRPVIETEIDIRLCFDRQRRAVFEFDRNIISVEFSDRVGGVDVGARDVAEIYHIVGAHIPEDIVAVAIIIIKLIRAVAARQSVIRIAVAAPQA